MTDSQDLLKLLVLVTSLGVFVSGEYVLVCHDGSEQITCPEGTRIEIKSAAYGNRGADTCTSQYLPEPCISPDSFIQINKRCFAKKSCVLDAKFTLFTNPCPGIGKYLEVDYECMDENILYPISAERTMAQSHTIRADQEVYVYSDDYPADYDPNLDCAATFVAELDKTIGITAIDFALPTSCTDQVNTNDEELCSLVSQKLVTIGNVYTIDVNRLSVHFTSDGAGAKRGFILKLQVFGCPSNTLPTLDNGGFAVTVAGAEATYYSNEGYNLIGGNIKYCVNGSDWEGDIGVCEESICPEGWLAVEGSCFRFVTGQDLSRDDANDHCATFAQGATLAVLDTRSKVDFVADRIREMNTPGPLGNYLWIKGHLDVPTGRWYWSDDNETEIELGSDLWFPNQPSNGEGDEYMDIIVRKNKHGINDVDGERLLPFICMLNDEEPRPRPPPPKVAFSVRCELSRPWVDQSTLPFGHIITNVGYGFNDTSSQFVAPVKGMYYFSWTTVSFLRQGLIGLMINEQLTPVTASWSPPVISIPGQVRPTSTNQIIKELEAGDRVFLKLLYGDVYCGAVYDYVDSLVTFTGYLMW